MTSKRGLVRLFAVMAILGAMLVPAAAASAQVTWECGEFFYEANNPDHMVYGRSYGTPVDADGRMIVDLSGMTPQRGNTFVIFWDRYFTGDSTGVTFIGSDYNDVFCGTYGSDWIWGKKGNDRLYGYGSYEFGTDPFYGGTYDNQWYLFTPIPFSLTGPVPKTTPGAVQLFTEDGDHLFGNKGNDFLTAGYANGAGSAGYESARLKGGIGDDIGILGSWCDGNTGPGANPFGFFGTPWFQGGAGNDTGLAGDGICNARMDGNDGNDWLEFFRAYNSVASGDNGEDTLFTGYGAAVNVYGGKGADDLRDGDHWGNGGGERMGLFGNADNDTFSQIGANEDATADGGPGDDTFFGNFYTGWDTVMFGGAGNDVIQGARSGGGDANDCLFGDYAAHIDELYPGGIGGYNPNTECHWGGFNPPWNWSASAFVNAQTSGDDTLWGRTGADTLFGGPGNDTMYGNYPSRIHPHIGGDIPETSGDRIDALWGGDGGDTMYGSGSSCNGDVVNGGANAIPVDTAWGFDETTDELAPLLTVETWYDQAPGCFTEGT